MGNGEEDRQKFFKPLADIGKIPCFRESFLYGSLGGVAIGLGYFLSTSRVLRSCYVAVGGYVLTTTGCWLYCRYNNAKRRFEQRMIQQGLQNMILYEGTQYDVTKKSTDSEEKRL